MAYGAVALKRAVKPPLTHNTRHGIPISHVAMCVGTADGHTAAGERTGESAQAGCQHNFRSGTVATT